MYGVRKAVTETEDTGSGEENDLTDQFLTPRPRLTGSPILGPLCANRPLYGERSAFSILPS